MSVSAEVHRTLVKSPPELWAELSDPTTLARHLGELGEIRILATEPDRAVDWEAATADGAQTSGRVEIEASGWGTRVTLSASRAMPELAAAAAPVAGSAPEASEPASEASGPEPEAQTEPEPEPAPVPAIIEPESRTGFLARLFRRRKRQSETEPAAETEPIVLVEVEQQPAPEETSPTEQAGERPEQPAEELAPEGPVDETSEADMSAELAELEQQTTAVLTGVLDRLGAAHHRPFSRA